MVQVELTAHLHTFFPDLRGKEIEVEASNVAEVVRAIDELAPGLSSYICDERGRLRRHVNIFIGNDRVRDRDGLSDPVDDRARVYILQALSGG